MHIKPTQGLRVFDPALRDFLPDEGRHVEASDYWQRHLRDGSVVIVQAPVAAPERARKGVDQQ
jgi:hypothetical protein